MKRMNINYVKMELILRKVYPHSIRSISRTIPPLCVSVATPCSLPHVGVSGENIPLGTAALRLTGEGHRQSIAAASAQCVTQRRLPEVCIAGEDVPHSLPQAGDGEALSAGQRVTHQHLHHLAYGHQPCGTSHKIFSTSKHLASFLYSVCAVLPIFEGLIEIFHSKLLP